MSVFVLVVGGGVGTHIWNWYICTIVGLKQGAFRAGVNEKVDVFRADVNKKVNAFRAGQSKGCIYMTAFRVFQYWRVASGGNFTKLYLTWSHKKNLEQNLRALQAEAISWNGVYQSGLESNAVTLLQKEGPFGTG